MVNYDYLYNKEYHANEINKNHFDNKKLHFRIIENATVLPHKALVINANETLELGGILDAQGNFVKNSGLSSGANGAYTPTAEIQHSNETVIYFGMLIHIWGHCITDCLKRAWFFKSDTYKKYFQNCKTIYTTMGGGRNNPQFSGIIKNSGCRYKNNASCYSTGKISQYNYSR